MGIKGTAIHSLSLYSMSTNKKAVKARSDLCVDEEEEWPQKKKKSKEPVKKEKIYDKQVLSVAKQFVKWALNLRCSGVAALFKDLRQ